MGSAAVLAPPGRAGNDRLHPRTDARCADDRYAFFSSWHQPYVPPPQTGDETVVGLAKLPERSLAAGTSRTRRRAGR